jgi:small subunit ribosomal protein S1
MAEAARKESFAELLNESLGRSGGLEGSVIKGTVISVDGDFALVDVGLKSEGRVPLKEFSVAGQPAEIKAGDLVEVFLERMEDKNGEAVLSREKARREEAWSQLEKSFQDNARVTGVIFGTIKGGFTVDLAAPSRSCPAARSTSARCATSPR